MMENFSQMERKYLLFFALIFLLCILAVLQLTIFAKLSPEEALREKLEAELEKDARLVIQVERSNEGLSAILNGNVTNVSSSQLNNLVINGMAFKDRGDSGFRYSVVDIFEEQKVFIGSLNPQEMLSFEMIIPEINWDGLKLDGVLFVQSEQSDEKEILQAVFID